MRHWCSGIMQDSHSCDPGSIPGQRMYFFANEEEEDLDNFQFKVLDLTSSFVFPGSMKN